jgi:hypothetical protein
LLRQTLAEVGEQIDFLKDGSATTLTPTVADLERSL